MSLRNQINLRILLIGLLILALGGLYAIWQARGAVAKETRSSLNLAASLIQLNFADDQVSSIDIHTWLPRFISLEQTRHLKIQLQQADGKLLKFIPNSLPEEDLNSPPAWFASWVVGDSPQIKQPLISADGKSLILYLQANPMDEVAEAWMESRAFFVALVLMTVLILVVVHLVFNKLLSATTDVVSALQKIEQGHYQFKLPPVSIEEFNHIASAINHLTEVLDYSREQNRALTLHSLEIQEDERQYLAKELHDELGQSLTGIKVMAVTAGQSTGDLTAITNSIIQICDHLIAVVRSMMRTLHPLVLRELGLRAALEDLINHWSSRYPDLKIKLKCDEAVDDLDSKISIQVFRIIQECITNIIRHAEANQAVLMLDFEESGTQSYLCLSVSDDGKGCHVDQFKKGFGLLGIQERLNSLDGTMSVLSQPGSGMNLQAKIPLLHKK